MASDIRVALPLTKTSWRSNRDKDPEDFDDPNPERTELISKFEHLNTVDTRFMSEVTLCNLKDRHRIPAPKDVVIPEYSDSTIISARMLPVPKSKRWWIKWYGSWAMLTFW